MVYFVGAGPGATDLITVRGAEKLKTADVVIYAGSLVNPELLDYTKESCEIHNSASMTLEQVIDVMQKAEKEDKMLVRLHTGDPSIYGAIREQMDILDEKNINYEVVPGVSSFFAASASMKMEYTLPDVSQTVIITRVAGRTPVPEKEDIAKLATHQASMVIFLSMGLLDKLSAGLIEGGYPADGPAAIVYKASWEDEKIVRTTVSELEKAAKENEITKTALVLVGGFLGDDYARSLLYHPEFTHEFREGNHES